MVDHPVHHPETSASYLASLIRDLSVVPFGGDCGHYLVVSRLVMIAAIIRDRERFVVLSLASPCGAGCALSMKMVGYSDERISSKACQPPKKQSQLFVSTYFSYKPS
jgi:hypothetical protein